MITSDWTDNDTQTPGIRYPLPSESRLSPSLTMERLERRPRRIRRPRQAPDCGGNLEDADGDDSSHSASVQDVTVPVRVGPDSNALTDVAPSELMGIGLLSPNDEGLN